LECVGPAVVAALLSSSAASAPAQAQGPASTNTARLEVDAAPSCSTRDELQARVAARSTRIRFVHDATGVPVLAVRIEPGPRGAVIAELTVTEPDGRRFARRIEAPSCAAATDALALVVAITLDPSAAGAEPSTATGSTTAAEAAAQPPPAPAPAPEPPLADNRAGGRAADAGEPAVPAAWRVTAGAAATVVAGPAPTPMPGVALEAAFARDRPSIWSPALALTVGQVWSGGLVEEGGTAEFTLGFLGLDACPVRLVLSRLEARVCAAGILGRLAAQGSHTFSPRAVAPLFASAGGSARLAVPLGSRVELRARFGGGATIWRDAFEFYPGVFHRVASVTLVGDVGIAVRFP
jgi:hypothetical protein